MIKIFFNNYNKDFTFIFANYVSMLNKFALK